MEITAGVTTASGAGFELCSVELDVLRHDEVLVKVRAVGVCHTDLTCIDGAYPAPMPSVFGHEGAGVVEEVGDGWRASRPVIGWSFRSTGADVVLDPLGNGFAQRLAELGGLDTAVDTSGQPTVITICFEALRPEGGSRSSGEPVPHEFVPALVDHCEPAASRWTSSSPPSRRPTSAKRSRPCGTTRSPSPS